MNTWMCGVLMELGDYERELWVSLSNLLKLLLTYTYFSHNEAKTIRLTIQEVTSGAILKK